MECNAGVKIRGDAFERRLEEISVVGFETDLAPWWVRRREQKWENLLVKIAQRGIMGKQGFIDLSETPGDDVIGAEFFAHPDECPDYVDAHGLSFGAVENVSGLKGAVLGKGKRKGTASAAAGF
jgi:hypothetical protein